MLLELVIQHLVSYDVPAFSDCISAASPIICITVFVDLFATISVSYIVKSKQFNRGCNDVVSITPKIVIILL